MKLPGFTAENSLRAGATQYRSAAPRARSYPGQGSSRSNSSGEGHCGLVVAVSARMLSHRQSGRSLAFAGALTCRIFRSDGTVTLAVIRPLAPDDVPGPRLQLLADVSGQLNAIRKEPGFQYHKLLPGL